MKPMRGYYCLIQFCPDPSRAEAVNLGTLLFCPDVKFIGARTSAGNHSAAKLVGRGGMTNEASTRPSTPSSAGYRPTGRHSRRWKTFRSSWTAGRTS